MFKNRTLLLVVWVIPVFFLFYSCVSYLHIQKTASSIHEMEAKFELAQSSDNQTYQWEGRSLPKQNAIDFYQAATEKFGKYINCINISHPISILAIIFSVLTLFSGIFAQRLCSRVISINASGLEPEEQASSFHWFRTILAFATSLHSACFLLTLICILICKLLLLPWAIKNFTTSPAVIMALEIVGAVVVAALIVCLAWSRRCLMLFSTTEPVIYGIPLSAHEEPDFWQWLSQTLQASNHPVPDNVVISLQQECYATVAPLTLTTGEKLQGLTLCIPVDRINTLSKRRMAEQIRQALTQPAELAPEVRHDLLESHLRLIQAQRPVARNRLDKVMYHCATAVAATLAGYFLDAWREAIYQQSSRQIWSMSNLTVKSDGSHAAGLLSSTRLYLTQLAQQLPKSDFPA
ncbi:hypothetical protein MXL54_18190 [Enterobacteriaceae bacterium G50]|nr:hypothetical protein [Enterobacteriaceae bacterium G50]